MDIDQALPTFVAESRELLQEMEASLLACEQHGADTDRIHSIFRAAHTIKGASGLFGLDHIVAFTHVMETALDRARAGSLAMSAELISLLLECSDQLKALVEAVGAGHPGQAYELPATALALLEKLRAVTGDPQPSPGTAEASPAVAAQTHSSSGPCAATEDWHLSLRFKPQVLRNGMDPLSFLRYLTTFAEIAGIVVISDALPGPESLDPECCYLGYEIRLRTSEERSRIEGAFEFVRDDCRLTLLAPRSPLEEYASLIHGLRESAERVGAALVHCGTLRREELEEALARWASGAAGQSASQSPQEERARASDNKAAEKRWMRVEADKLDRLIDLIGELIVAGAGTHLVATGAGLPELGESASRLLRLVEDVRDSALKLRMVQIGATFSRFHRIVRDVARQLDKEIDLYVSGAETELDKTVVERINDPLVHLVRNAMDHGIEPAEVRIARGKPKRGTVQLNAYHDSGSVVIEVSDDGGGISRDRVRAKAIERGLIAPDAVLTDREVFGLIMEPGFSTAGTITNLSGRGVGMDVVKRNIEQLRGTIEIDSEEGVGTTMRIRMPLTLAIISGFQMQVDRACYVVPLELVEECVELPPGCEDQGSSFIDLRGQVLPFLRLRELFELESPRPKRESVVVVRWGNQRMGLVVDALLGELQAVIKPLGRMFSKLRGVAGSTILGDGSVALILDVPALAERAIHRRDPAVPATREPHSAAFES